jgi:stage II sporulation protein AA (anti-sigma F factor antagonist)
MLCYEKNKNTLTVRLSGELDHSAAKGMRRELDALIAQTDAKKLVFDLKGLEFMDSSGIGLIIGRYKVMTGRGGSVAVCDPGARVDQIFRMAGLYQLVDRLA